MLRKLMRLGRSTVVAVPTEVLEMLDIKVGDTIEYKILKNNTIKFTKPKIKK